MEGQYVLRRKETGEYFAGRGWVGEEELALRFDVAGDAGRTCVALGLGEMEVVVLGCEKEPGCIVGK